MGLLHIRSSYGYIFSYLLRPNYERVFRSFNGSRGTFPRQENTGERERERNLKLFYLHFCYFLSGITGKIVYNKYNQCINMHVNLLYRTITLIVT